MAITTNMTTSFKSELMQAGHNFAAVATPTVTAGSSGATTLTSVSSMASVIVGAAVTGTSIASNTVVSRILSSNSFEISKGTTGTISAAAVTVSPDVYMVALIKPSMAGTYGTGSVNYTDITGNSDETTNSSGTAYTAGGLALTNSGVSTSGTTAYTTFASNPSWSSASFSTAGCMIYNSSVRIGGTSGTNTTGGGRAVGVYDFGGTQQVASGVFTITLPSAGASTAVIRVA